ncbi:hypothetical protein TanjilG_21517 [Lupinus angustifolius]|uniref:Polygalacturonase n=1 Tax=Lupinus angustifolius TaxID=3871 RepID=A0A4P1QUD0_LUPAN|nr:hypothetical protein TanjilG_21517 [Lupinus angustifolius]
MEYGAVGDGMTDDSQAFLKAWSDACGISDSFGTLEVPNGNTFMLKPITFNGPCKFSEVHFKLEGNIVAPSSTEAWTENVDKNRWIQFTNVTSLVMNGGGQIDGQGSIWWKICKALSFKNCNKLQLSAIQHINSAKGHISITSCVQTRIRDLIITAPEDSPNTDGIDINESKDIIIQNCTIATGDDCIAMNKGTSNINITAITCGPGHGISIGSLGKNGDFATVENVYVNNCTFKGTTNGVRIKTWPEGYGYVRNVTFNKIRLYNTRNPIIINQNYKDKQEEGKGFEINGVTYQDVSGTSATSVAINLGCNSNGGGCTNIIMDTVNLTSISSNKVVTASCTNVKGQETQVSPKVPCLTEKPPSTLIGAGIRTGESNTRL